MKAFSLKLSVEALQTSPLRGIRFANLRNFSAIAASLMQILRIASALARVELKL
jgi:hypothetical protein